MRRYRIVADRWLGYEVQFKPWWWPFWMQAGMTGSFGTNTHSTIAKAEAFAERHAGGGVVKDLGWLPSAMRALPGRAEPGTGSGSEATSTRSCEAGGAQ